jgi:hypothetical protein
MIAVPAFADLDSIIAEYNRNTILTSAANISDNPEVSQQDETTRYDFQITDNVIVSLSVKEDRIRVCSVICKDESETAEFLAQCAASASTVSESPYYMYAEILDLFLQVRAGEAPGQRKSQTAGVVYQLTKETFGYLFMIAR